MSLNEPPEQPAFDPDEFIGSLAIVSPGHRINKDVNEVDPDKRDREAQSKLSIVYWTRRKLLNSSSEGGDKLRQALEKVRDLYPEQSAFLASEVDRLDDITAYKEVFEEKK